MLITKQLYFRLYLIVFVNVIFLTGRAFADTEILSNCEASFNKSEYINAISICENDFHNGLGKAAYFLGTMYEKGSGTTANIDLAISWYKKGSSLNDAASIFWLGMNYILKQEFSDKKEYGFELVKKAANLGYPNAQNELGLMYGEGEIIKRDFSKAVKWFRLAAENNDHRGQYNLAFAYENGYGLIKDEIIALNWYKKSAALGYADAQHKVAAMYISGRGVDKNIETAIYWLEKSAKQNYLQSQINLAFTYFKGDAVLTDNYKAYIWASLAQKHEKNGDKIAITIKEYSKSKLSAKQLDRANEEVSRLSSMFEKNL